MSIKSTVEAIVWPLNELSLTVTTQLELRLNKSTFHIDHDQQKGSHLPFWFKLSTEKASSKMAINKLKTMKFATKVINKKNGMQVWGSARNIQSQRGSTHSPQSTRNTWIISWNLNRLLGTYHQKRKDKISEIPLWWSVHAHFGETLEILVLFRIQLLS